MDKRMVRVWEKDIEGEILAEERVSGTDYMLFHKSGSPENEVDILYYNFNSGCWKSECECMGDGYEYYAVMELMKEHSKDIVDTLWEGNYRLTSCYTC